MLDVLDASPNVTPVRLWRRTSLRPNPRNPRGEIDPTTVEDLAASIRVQGILQPLLVTPDGVVVAGHRRLAAAELVGLELVPALERQLEPAEQIEIMLVENLQREDLSPLQEARAYRALMDQGLTQAEVARRIGVHHVRVCERLDILELDAEVQAMYGRCELPVTLAHALSKVIDPHQQRRLANVAARRQMPARAIEDLIKRSIGELEVVARERNPLPPRPVGLSQPRAELLVTLRAEPETTISFEDLARACEDTCCWCGLDSQPEICANCPMPILLRRVVALA